ncbi:uncharacterized protein LOC144988406 [Oryzias latipes]
MDVDSDEEVNAGRRFVPRRRTIGTNTGTSPEGPQASVEDSESDSDNDRAMMAYLKKRIKESRQSGSDSSELESGGESVESYDDKEIFPAHLWGFGNHEIDCECCNCVFWRAKYRRNYYQSKHGRIYYDRTTQTGATESTSAPAQPEKSEPACVDRGTRPITSRFTSKKMRLAQAKSHFRRTGDIYVDSTSDEDEPRKP